MLCCIPKSFFRIPLSIIVRFRLKSGLFPLTKKLTVGCMLFYRVAFWKISRIL